MGLGKIRFQKKSFEQQRCFWKANSTYDLAVTPNRDMFVAQKYDIVALSIGEWLKTSRTHGIAACSSKLKPVRSKQVLHLGIIIPVHLLMKRSFVDRQWHYRLCCCCCCCAATMPVLVAIAVAMVCCCCCC